MDTLKARISYSQLRSLPFVVVAERVIRGNSMAMYKRLLGPALTMTGVLALACLASIVLLLRIFSPKSTPKLASKAPPQMASKEASVGVFAESSVDAAHAQVVEAALEKFEGDFEGDEDEFDEMLDEMIEAPQPTRQIQIPVEIAPIDRTKITSQVQATATVKTNELPS